MANAYKQAIATAIGRLAAPAHDAAIALDKASSAMSAKAWVAPQADIFASGLTSQKTATRAAGDGCKDNLQRAHSSEPEKVPPDSWKATFRA